jgi:hypothetical protein
MPFITGPRKGTIKEEMKSLLPNLVQAEGDLLWAACCARFVDFVLGWVASN